ncbi:MAG TPA: class I SAM-dependent methyltransferase [Bryobacterales bacterium]|nr:class I SAM-dependent methyltransferase [Bryobacterales bacterium]
MPASSIGKKFFYTSIAGEFDRMMNPYDLERRLEVVFEQLLLGSLAGRLVLDAGCGTGWFAARAQYGGACVVALDLGPPLLEEARRKAPVFAAAGDALELPFRDNTFDIVISSEAIEHTIDPARAIREMARVLRPEGTLVLTCPNRFWQWLVGFANCAGLRRFDGYENFPSFHGLEQYIAAAGLALECHIGFHPWPFQLRPLWGVSRWVDAKLGGGWARRFMINQAVRASKRHVQP